MPAAIQIHIKSDFLSGSIPVAVRHRVKSGYSQAVTSKDRMEASKERKPFFIRLLIPVVWTAVSHAAGRGRDLPGIEVEQMPGTGKSALKSKILPGVLQGFNDVEVLRALGLAGTAADTAVSTGIRRENLFKVAVFF